MIRLAVFDIDGTLIKTKDECIYRFVGESGADCGLNLAEGQMKEFWFGMDRNAAISSWGIEPREFWERFRVHDNPEIRKGYIEAYDDIGIIAYIRQRARVATLTNSPPWIMAINLEKLPIFDYSLNAMGNKLRPKPHPDGIEECMRLAGASREETIMVGNAPEDYYAAQNAGVSVYIVDRGEHNLHMPGKAMKSLSELAPVFDNQPY